MPQLPVYRKHEACLLSVQSSPKRNFSEETFWKLPFFWGTTINDLGRGLEEIERKIFLEAFRFENFLHCKTCVIPTADCNILCPPPRSLMVIPSGKDLGQ